MTDVPVPSPAPTFEVPEQPSLAERISELYERLKVAAAELNEVSDALGKPIPIIESALQALNLGIEAWVVFYSDGDSEFEQGEFRLIGYAKVNGKWGLAIELREGDYTVPDTERWAFGDAPRAFRIDAVDKIPALIEQLLEAAQQTKDELKRKVESTNEVAEGLAKAATKKSVKK